MIIISQDKKTVINSDNVHTFRIYDETSEYNKGWYICADGEDIAQYDTEKEAMDTLKEMSAMIAAGNKDYVIE